MPPAAPSLPTRFPCWCRAVYSWGGESKRDLGFIEGDLIECLNAGDGSWWVGRLYRDRRSVGSFPSNFVEVLPPDFRPTTRSVSPLPPTSSNTPSPTPVTKSKTFRKPFEAYAKAPHYTTAKQPETFREIVKPSKRDGSRNSPTSNSRHERPSPPPIQQQPPEYISRAPSPAPSRAFDYGERAHSPAPPLQHHGSATRATSPLPQQHRGFDSRAASPAPPLQHHPSFDSRAASPAPPPERYGYDSRLVSPGHPSQYHGFGSRAASPAPPPQHQSSYISRAPSPASRNFSFERTPSFNGPPPGDDEPPPPPPPPHRHVVRKESTELKDTPYDISRHGSNGSFMPYSPERMSRQNSSHSYNEHPLPPRHGSHGSLHSQPYGPSTPAHRAATPSSANRPSPGAGSHMTPSPLREAMDGVMEQLDELQSLGGPGENPPTEDSRNPWSPESFNMLSSPSRKRSQAPMRPMTSMGIAPSDEGYETWSGESSQDASQKNGAYEKNELDRSELPQLETYVQRMERRFQNMHEQGASTPPAHLDEDMPPPPPPKGEPFERPKSSMGGTARAPPSPERKLRARKSAYAIGDGVSRTYTTKTNSTEASSGNQSNASASTQSSGRTLWSGDSAGAFSTTSAGSLARHARRPQSAFGMRDADVERPETPFTGVTYHSSHASDVQAARRPMSQAVFTEDSSSGLGGLVHPRAPKRNIFKKIFESARTGVASGRAGVPGGMVGGIDTAGSSPMGRPMTPGASPPKTPMVGIGNPYMSRETSRDGGPASGVDWVQVRRDVNRSNSLSSRERTERRERCQMLDHPTLNPVDELYEGVEGDEGADGNPIFDPVNYQAINLSQVDKNTRFVAGLPPVTTSITLATTYVCRPYRSDVQRLRAIFTWVAEKIRWEEDFEGEIDTRHVIQNKRACAKEYAVLVMEMCDAIGIHCEIVRGYLKGPGEVPDLNLMPRSNHWWNAVVVDNEWRIIDCCLASPSYPRRGDYSSAPSTTADFWYFLTRPLEACWTHVPEHHDQQHIVPPVAHETLLNLPCTNPAFFRQGIEMVDYNTSLGRIEDLEMVHIKFNVPAEVEVAAEVEARAYTRDADGDVFESGDVTKKRALAQAEWFNGVKRYTIKALLPADEGQGILKVYAGQRGLMHSIKDIPHPLAFSVPIIHTGENPPYEFVTRHPTPHAQRHDIYVVQPQCQRLALNNTFVFAIRQHPSSVSGGPQSALTPASNPGATSPVPFARPGSAMSMNASHSGAASNPSSASGTVAGKKPAKLAIQTPGGKILRLMRKEDRKGISVGSRLGGEEDASDGGTWETIIKCSEKGTWRGLVLADRTARWCVFAEWVCVS